MFLRVEYNTEGLDSAFRRYLHVEEGYILRIKRRPERLNKLRIMYLRV
jgi:hypothetical protein